MGINNKLLKPLITSDNKKGEIKVYKKFFKSNNDDNLEIKNNNMFYDSQKLTEKEKKELKGKKKLQ